VERLTVVCDVFRQYLKSKRAFLTVAERCTIKGWPDLKPAILGAYKLQFLFNERESLRFEYCIETDGFWTGCWASVSSISRRLDRHWTEGEERELVRRVPRYKEIVDEIAGLQETLVAGAIHKPLEAARRDPEYGAALLAIQEELRTLDARLASTSAGTGGAG